MQRNNTDLIYKLRKHEIFFLSLLSITGYTLAIMSIFFGQMIFDGIISTGNNNQLYQMAFFFCLVAIGQVILQYTQGIIKGKLGFISSYNQTRRIIELTLQSKFSFISNKTLSETISYIGIGKNTQKKYSSIIPTLASDIPCFLLLLVLIFWYSQQLAFIALIGIVLVGIVKLIFIRDITNFSEEKTIIASKENLLAIETVKSYKSVRLSRKINTITIRYMQHMNTAFETSMRELRYKTLQASIQNGIHTTTGVLILAMGVNLTLEGKLSVGEMLAFILLKSQAESRGMAIIERMFDLPQLKHGERKISELIENKEEHYCVGKNKGKISSPAISVSVNDVSFSYKNNLKLISNLNINIKQGEILCIYGGSGKGKTTLLNIIAGFLAPDSGEIIFHQDNNKIRVASPLISGCFHDDILLTGTILQTITWHDSEPNEKLAETCLEISSAKEFVESLHNGWHSFIEEGGKNFSLGQRQRLLLARAIYQRPQLLILDEFTNHLDSTSEKIVMEGIKTLGCTCIIVSHSRNVREYADATLEI